jgi:hypothetical protein
MHNYNIFEWTDWFNESEPDFTKFGNRKKPPYQNLVDFVSNSMNELAQNKKIIIDSFDYCGISYDFRINRLNGKLLRYFYFEDDWDAEGYYEWFIKNSVVDTGACESDSQNESEKELEFDQEVFDFEGLLELERRLTLQSQETEQEFNSDFISV